MKNSGLVDSKSALVFHSWSPDTGPLVETNEEIWHDIDAALVKGKVEVAAASLRHHLEYVANNLCGELAAQTVFKPDGGYDLGDLLPAAHSRLKKLLSRAATAEMSWGHHAEHDAALELKQKLSDCVAASQIEQWAINKGVHYNAWANFGKTDFAPVIEAFKELVELFQCDDCKGWLYLDNKQTPSGLRCGCGKTAFNLNKKSK
jgi:hypothetical protein